MDIALRKDLVDIQELIANPPPMTADANPKSRRQKTYGESSRRARLIQMEQGFGQLHRESSSQRLQHQQQVVLKTKHKSRQRERDLSRHHANLPSEYHSNELEHRIQTLHLHQNETTAHKQDERCQKEGAFRVRGGDNQHLTISSASFLRSTKMAVDELAVDVPDDIGLHKQANKYNCKQLVNNRAAAFSSLHSLAPAASNGHKRMVSGKLESQFRIKTIEDLSNQVDLHLLPTLTNVSEATGRDSRMRSRKVGSECKRVTSSLELSGQSTSGEACLPDACDNPDDWADIMAKSALYRSTNSPVIESQLVLLSPNDKRRELKERSSKTLVVGGRKIKLPSPSGSIRSSVSKSQGRVVVRRGKQKASSLVRRPNLGTCVGKLSLLKLRGIVNKRLEASRNDEQLFDEEVEDKHEENRDERQQQQQVEVEAKGEEEEEADKVGEKSATKANNVPTATQRKTPVATGRRQERIERLEHSCVLLAPNGNQLVRARPLASLTDDTQLYAIPKKTKVSVSGFKLNLSSRQDLLFCIY